MVRLGATSLNWSVSTNRNKMTDVECLVREEAFNAYGGMKEAETVCIEDVDPTVFKQFLEFLYSMGCSSR